MIRDNSIGNPFMDSVRNTTGTRRGFSGYTNITRGRIRNVPSAEYHGHLTGTYMVALDDSGTDQLIPCKVLSSSASMDGVGTYSPHEEGDPVTILFKEGRMDMGYIVGGDFTEGKYREFLIEGKGNDPFSLVDTGSKEAEINQPSIHPDRIATPDAFFNIVGSRELGKDPYSDVALGDPFNLPEAASQRPQPGSIQIRNKQGDVAQYAKGDIILYADGDIILLSTKTKDAECNKLRLRVQYYKDLIKKLERKFKGNASSSPSSSLNSSSNTNNEDKSTTSNTSITDSFKIDSKTQKLSTTKIDGLVDLLTSKNISKFPNDDKAQYSIANKNKGTNNNPGSNKDKKEDKENKDISNLNKDPLKKAQLLKDQALEKLTEAKGKSDIEEIGKVIEEGLKEIDKVPKSSPSYPQASTLKFELETLNKQIKIDPSADAPGNKEVPDDKERGTSLPPDHPKNREKYTVDAILNADYLEPYILRYHIDQLNKLVQITTSEIEACTRDIASVKTTSVSSSSSTPKTQTSPNQSTSDYNPRKSKCGMTLVEIIKDLSTHTGKSYGSGTCYEGVADAIEWVGLGKLGGDCQIGGPNSISNLMAGYTSWAVHFADFFNEDPNRLKQMEIRNLKAEGIVDPNDPRVPPGAVIVVSENEFVARIEGDINIKTDDGQFLNPRSMTSWMNQSDYWKAHPDEVLGIFIDAQSSPSNNTTNSNSSPSPSSSNTPIPSSTPISSTQA